jgi:hypothetical protein
VAGSVAPPGTPTPTDGAAEVAGAVGGSRFSGPAVGPESAIGVPTGARRPPLDISLAAALSMLVDERAPVTLVTTSGEETSGRLVALGDDVVTIQADGPARGPAYVRLDALGLCELR